MSRVRNCAFLLSLLTATLTSAQAAGLYKWTDEGGTVHYSQIPPTEHQAQVITPEKSPQSPSPTADKKVANGKTEPPLPEGMTQEEDAAAQIKRQNCETAQKNLAAYQSSSKIIEPDGTEVMLSSEMREAKLKETQVQIRLYCQ